MNFSVLTLDSQYTVFSEHTGRAVYLSLGLGYIQKPRHRSTGLEHVSGHWNVFVLVSSVCFV